MQIFFGEEPSRFVMFIRLDYLSFWASLKIQLFFIFSQNVDVSFKKIHPLFYKGDHRLRHQEHHLLQPDQPGWLLSLPSLLGFAVDRI